MKSLAERKLDLIRFVLETDDLEVLLQMKKILEQYSLEKSSSISEPESIYNSEKPMTEEEVEKYFKEESITLPKEILEILKISQEQVKNGEYYTHEEVEKYFDEWLKD